MPPSWILRLFPALTRASRKIAKPARPTRRSFRPTLEVLETRLTPSTLITLEAFNGTNGRSPIAGVIEDGSGNLFGTTATGGSGGAGTVFELLNGSYSLSTLAS